MKLLHKKLVNKRIAHKKLQKIINKRQKAAARGIALLLSCVFMLAAAGCAISVNAQQPANGQKYRSYLDVPGVTEGEIEAIELLQAQDTPFIYAASRSTELFENSDGTLSGYTVLLCQWLSDMFGIDVRPEVQGLNAMLENLANGSIAFATLSVTSQRQQDYYMTDTIAQRSLKMLRIDGVRPIAEISRERLPRYVFTESSVVYQIVTDALQPGTYEVVMVSDEEEAYMALKDGEADAFIATNTMEAAYDHYGGVHAEDFLPLIYLPAAMTASDPVFEPVISVVTKALQSNASEYLIGLYEQGYQEYKKHKLSLLLTEEEAEYIANNPVIPVATHYMSYPMSFFNVSDREWEGVGIDALREVSLLTGLEFEVINEPNLQSYELIEILEREEAYIIPYMIMSSERRDSVLWSTADMYMFDRFALLSKQSTPNVELNDIPFMRVGLPKRTSFAEFFYEWFPNAMYVTEYPTTDDAFYALDRDEIDFVMATQSRLSALSNYYDFSDYKANYIFNHPFEARMVFSKNSEVLRSIIDKALNMVDTDRIVQQWLTRTYNIEEMRLSSQRPWLIGAVALAAVVIVLILVLYYRSRRLTLSLIENIAEKDIMESEILYNQVLLSELNKASADLLDTDIDTFEGALHHSMEALAKAVSADRMFIWKNHMLDDQLCTTQIYEWHGEDVEPHQGTPFTTNVSYREVMPEYVKLKDGDCMNGITRFMEPKFKKYLTDNGVLSILIAPVFLDGEFWGLVGFDDCKNERVFTGQEEDMLHSASLLFAYAYQRNEMLKDLKEASNQLSEALAEANRANRAKTDFIAKMSHEIRTPMNAVIGMTELALRTDDIDTMHEYAFTVKQAGSNLLSLINDILDFSKIEAGKMEIVPKEYSMSSLLNDVISIIRMRAVNSQLPFAVRVDSRIPNTLYGDETRIRQALLNVLGNAVKYTEKGFISFSVFGEFIDDETLTLTFEIADSGIGIKPEDMSKLFVDFSQVNIETHTGIEGTGLGLAITRNIVNAMGGDVTVQSKYGKGSTFTIVIPQKYQVREALATVQNPQEKSVLIFEQRDVYADSIAYTLGNLGIEFALAENSGDLRDKMESGKFNHLFISYAMYMDNRDEVMRFRDDARIFVLTDFGEVIPEKSLFVLSMPVYCTHISEMLSGTRGNLLFSAGGADATVEFTVPGARILIVDDIYTNLKVAEGLLEPYKVKIDLCSGGAAAIEAVRSVHYDLIFMDHKMPGVDGVEATKAIRALGTDGDGVEPDPYYRQVPIIALTANAVLDTKEMFLNNGFNDYLFKPVDTIKLDAVMRKWLKNQTVTN